MKKNNFKNISLNGRVAFAIRCFENALVYLEYNITDWKIVLEHLWKFTSADNLEAWNDTIVELIPENLLEFRTYDEHDFEYLDEKTFEYLYKLYQNIDETTNYLIRQIYYIGSSHSYSRVVDYGQRSLDEIERLINYMGENNIPLPDINTFEKFSIEENQGWGHKFNGKELSNLL